MAYILRHYGRRFGTFASIKAQNSSTCSVSLEEGPRINKAGIQQLSPSLHRQLFNGLLTEPSEKLVSLSQMHLRRHGLLVKRTDPSPPIEMNLPPLRGSTLDEHFYNLGMDIAEPYLSKASSLAYVNLPPMPTEFLREPGWHRYSVINSSKNPQNTHFAVEKVDYPKDDCLVFDTEVLYKISQYPVMACAASREAWYVWVSPWITGHSDHPEHLVPLPSLDKERIIVGHNIGYDRARIKEQYSFKEHKVAFIDTMSLHVAVNGMCSRQRPTWLKHKKNKELKDRITAEANTAELASLLEDLEFEEFDEPWLSKSSTNSLLEVAQLHCNITPDKSIRDLFGELDKDGVFTQFQDLVKYCAEDVRITHEVYKTVFPRFRNVCPHPVSFVGLIRLASVFLPVNKSWEAYISKAEGIYRKMSTEIQKRLENLANEAVEEFKDSPHKVENDPWLRQLDWSVQKVRQVLDKQTKEMRPPKGSKKPGYPNWYRTLYPTSKKPMNVTVRTRIAPILLRLSWEGNPLVWSEKYGWTFRLVDPSSATVYEAKHFVRCEMSEDPNEMFKLDTEGIYFKVPHKDGASARCCSPLAKNYIKAFEDGVLQSEFPYAREALNMNAACSYWISARERITSQFVVWRSKEHDLGIEENSAQVGVILPQIIPMGTITRRAVEKTWLTASNAKKNRIGSELKAMVKAPDGYTFVGADVDSEELWIASLIGDAQFKHHGATAMGWMTLEGTKSAGTDMHSKTASILGISRNAAKIFNYGRIYGAGVSFACQLLQQFNPSISEVDAKKVATNLYEATKGHKLSSHYRSLKTCRGKKKFWRGGTESFVFNKLEEIADQDCPQTPVLGCRITEALLRNNLSKGAFMTSRVNWAIQSSGVDYLHLLIVSMEYLIRRYNIDARLCLTVHDEIRFLVKEHHKYRAALALQISNLWTRAMFCQQLGINDVPQGCAFFSAVDIDKVLRKEVDLDCVTPSNDTAIPPGESLSIQGLLAKNEAFLDERTIPKQPFMKNCWPYEPRSEIAEKHSNSDIAYLEAQIMATDEIKQKSKLVSKQPVVQKHHQPLHSSSTDGFTFQSLEYQDLSELSI